MHAFAIEVQVATPSPKVFEESGPATKVLAVAFILLPLAFLAWAGIGEYRESFGSAARNYVALAVPEIARAWEPSQLLERADPQLLSTVPASDLRKTLAMLSSALGPGKRSEIRFGVVSFTLGSGFGWHASFIVDLVCEKGAATVTVNVRQRGRSWKILGFWVSPTENSPIGRAAAVS
jgi:hypothetical protein